VIVGDLDLESIALPPDEANSPLVIDPNAVLALAVAREFFEVVSRRNIQICQAIRCIQNPKLDVGPALYIMGKAATWLPIKDFF
jgi:hypothetical protein